MLWIMGLVSVGALGISFLLSVLYMAITLFGNAGRHIRFIAIPSACVPDVLSAHIRGAVSCVHLHIRALGQCISPQEACRTGVRGMLQHPPTGESCSCTLTSRSMLHLYGKAEFISEGCCCGHNLGDAA